MATSKKVQEIIDQVKQSRVLVPWCDEFEKMISGMNFHSPDSPKMLEHRLKVMKLLQEFNDTTILESDTTQSLEARRMGIAEQIMGRVGVGVNIERPLFCLRGCNMFIGDNVYINRDVSIHDNAPVHIGNNVLIGPGVCICTATHVSDALERAKGGSYALPIVIEDYCWIGANATILPGVRIGKGSIVAAGAAVCKDVGEGVLVGGVPARVLKTLGK